MGLVPPLPAIYMAGVLTGDANICSEVPGFRPWNFSPPPAPGPTWLPLPVSTSSHSSRWVFEGRSSSRRCLSAVICQALPLPPIPPFAADTVWSTLSPTASNGANTCYYTLAWAAISLPLVWYRPKAWIHGPLSSQVGHKETKHIIYEFLRFAYSHLIIFLTF